MSETQTGTFFRRYGMLTFELRKFGKDRERPGVKNILLKMTEDGVRTVPMFPEKKLSVYRFSNVIATVFKAMKKDEQQTRKEIIR